jgi:hypothetical protein
VVVGERNPHTWDYRSVILDDHAVFGPNVASARGAIALRKDGVRSRFQLLGVGSSFAATAFSAAIRVRPSGLGAD